MSQDVIIELVRLIPSVLWVLLIAVLIAIFYRPIRHEILPRLRGVNAFGLEVTLLEEELDKVVGAREGTISPSDRAKVLHRAERIAPILRGAQLLWVDDNPKGNIYEREILRSFGIFVDLAKTSSEALEMIRQNHYDVIISDMKRGQVADEGLHFVEAIRQQGSDMYRWTIFYFRNFKREKGVTPYAFGMTNRPDEMLHLILDILERKRS